MSIPIVSGAFRGWTRRRFVRVTTKNVIDFIVKQTAENILMDIMIQPLNPERVNRKPEDQRSWKWSSVLTKASNRLLKIDDQIEVAGISYRIDSVQAWDEAGYRRYEATEAYSGDTPQEYLTT